MSSPANILLLLVEDDENDIIITKRKIAKSSIKLKDLVVVNTLAEGKAIVATTQFDVVLLDLNLPDSSGLNTLEEMRKVYDGILIVLTSIDDEMVGVEAIKSGADDYLVKTNLNEKILSGAIYYSIERRKRWSRASSVTSQIETLDNMISNRRV